MPPYYQTDHRKGGVGLLFFQTDHDLAVVPMTHQNRLWTIGLQYERVVAKLECDKSLSNKQDLDNKCQALVNAAHTDMLTLQQTYDPAFEDPESCGEKELEFMSLMRSCYGKIFTAALLTGMLERSFGDAEVLAE